MKCRNCGIDNPDEATLCSKCGATLPTTVSGKSLPPDAYFDNVTTVAIFIGFTMMVVGGWLIGGKAGAGIFFSLFGAVVVTISMLNYYLVRDK